MNFLLLLYFVHYMLCNDLLKIAAHQTYKKLTKMGKNGAFYPKTFVTHKDGMLVKSEVMTKDLTSFNLMR